MFSLQNLFYVQSQLKQKGLNGRKPVFNEMKQKNLLLVFGLIATVLFAVYSIHINYYLPYHSEEYDHLILAKETTGEEKVKIGFNWETGFSVFFGILNALLLNNLNEFLIFIPIVFGLIISFSSFLLGRFLFRNSLAGLLFGLFALMIPSNPGIMGLFFAVPNSMALALTPMLLYLFLKGTTNKKIAILFMILFAFTTIVHPAFTIMLLPIIALYLLLNPKLFKKNQFKIAVGIILLIILLPFFASRIGVEEVSLTHESFTLISKNLERVLVWSSITQYNPKFFLSDFLGVYLLAFSGIGFGLITSMRFLIELKRKKGQQSVLEKDFTVSRHQIILPIGILILGSLYLHFNLKDYTFIAPYERMYLTLMLFLLLSAAAGIFLIWKILNKKINAENTKPYSIAVIAVVLFFLSTVPFAQESELYKNIETKGVSSIEWIENFTEKKSSFIALPKHSIAIKFFTEREIFASPPTRAGIADPFKLEVFFISNCDQKKDAAEKIDADYVFGEKEIDCRFLEKIYDKKEYKIYSVLKP